MNDLPERKSPFTRRLRLVWDDTLVMDAQCSNVIAYDIARAFFSDQFAGPELKGWLASRFDRNALERLVSTGRLDVEWKDGTGYARAFVEPVQ